MMTRRHLSFSMRGSNPGRLPDFQQLLDAINPNVLEAMHAVSAKLGELGIRHAIAGGLAVSAWGTPRATMDVDFLVGDEAFQIHGGGFVTFADGVPIQYQQIPVDLLSIQPSEGFLIPAIERPVIAGGIPLLPVEALVYLKLKSPRARDRNDIITLVQAGLDVAAVSQYIARNAPAFSEKFERLVKDAQEE